ncbi:unnamed protein product [Adineta steineri]|uniref:Uncharacterized protein n=1 Tax=Adineta steineri TaxID=433720 RepID=A0A813UQT6_9BILA|nr:unnamed protein product [Adineta steineri]CAF3667829.1 unnamed protein product [Adineta steineri]
MLIFSTLSMPVLSLECYSCKESFVLNYIVTSNTVPTFTGCQLFNASVCYMKVTWDQNNNRTLIVIDLTSTSSTKNVVDTPDFLATGVKMQVVPHQEHINFEHSLVFVCTTINRGNNEETLKRILRSLVIEDQFRKEIYPLLKTVSPLDAKAAECFEFHNGTSGCPQKDLDKCQRCYGSTSNDLSSNDVEFCQTCPDTQDYANSAYHSSSFELKSHKRTEDEIVLTCQLKRCNSIDNINRVVKASKITFDFDEFYKITSNNIV